MAKSDFCQLWLSCVGTAEAARIAQVLLQKHLIACAKQMPITSDFHWQGKIEHSNETLLLMDSRLDLFEQVEEEVAKLHSYETFVLQAVPTTKISKEAEKWLAKETNGQR